MAIFNAFYIYAWKIYTNLIQTKLHLHVEHSMFAQFIIFWQQKVLLIWSPLNIWIVAHMGHNSYCVAHIGLTYQLALKMNTENVTFAPKLISTDLAIKNSKPAPKI